MIGIKEEEKMAEFKYEITEELGVLSESNNGWKKEFNKISWNERNPKYDIRDWANEHERMGKGVTLTEEELRELYTLISQEIKKLDSKK